MVDYSLITTIIGSIVTAAIFGYLAMKVKLSPIVGYLMAGVVIGPFTPGFVADVQLAKQLAEIGIILLMFGVGLHFSIKDLGNVRKIAVPGAVVQMTTATLLGGMLMYAAGYELTESIVFGFCLSVASTVVLLRALEERNKTNTETGKIAIGWLIVEDIAMVLAIVMLPVIARMLTAEAGTFNIEILLTTIFEVALKIGGFVVLMLVVGRRLLPQILTQVEKKKSDELLSLTILAIAVGFAYLAYSAFDASFALGAFLAGLVLNESKIGHDAAETTKPLRDTFAILFFVSVGMLFNPIIIVEKPLFVAMTVFIIVIGKTIAAMAIAKLFKQTTETTVIIGLSLAQIGEFSFILAGMAITLSLISMELYNLVLAGALLSIALNPILFEVAERFIIGKKPAAKKEPL